MKYQKNIKITVSKAEQETINNILTILADIDIGCEMDDSDIYSVFEAISEISEKAETSAFDNIEIEYGE